jgi:hypothetical protein
MSPGNPTGATDVAVGTGVAEIDTIARSSVDIVTTTTADPGTTAPTTTLAVTDRTCGGRVGTTDANYYISVIGTSGIREIMLVTGGGGAGAGSLNVTRAQMGSTAVAHSVGAKVAKIVWVQRVEPVDGSKEVSFKGRFTIFDTPGRAGTVGQKVAAIHNASASTVLVDVEKITIDLVMAAAAGQAATILPPKIRVWRFTAVPTNGTAMTKVPEDSSLTSNSAVTVWGDASADTTGSVTTLTITLPAGNALAQAFAPRLLLIGTTGSTTQVPPTYEPFDRETFLEDEMNAITLRPLEGICLFIDYVVATNNPITNHWVATMRWTEYRPA